jgi:TolC family type I secretion outer membrane protein
VDNQTGDGPRGYAHTTHVPELFHPPMRPLRSLPAVAALLTLPAAFVPPYQGLCAGATALQRQMARDYRIQPTLATGGVSLPEGMAYRWKSGLAYARGIGLEEGMAYAYSTETLASAEGVSLEHAIAHAYQANSNLSAVAGEGDTGGAESDAVNGLEDSTSPAGGGVSLEQALANAYQTNPTLAAAQAQLRAIAETVPQARSGYLPDISLQGNEGRTRTRQHTRDSSSKGEIIDNLNETQTDRSVELSVTLNLYEGGQTAAATSAAEAQVAAGVAELNAAEQQVLLDAATAYADVALYQALYDLSVESENELKRLQDWADEMFSHQQITITYVADVKAQLAAARASTAEMLGYQRAMESNFKAVTGLQAGVLYRWPSFKVPFASLAEGKKMASTTNPLIRQAEYGLQAGEFLVRQLEGSLLPSVDLYNTLSRQWDKSRFTGSDDYKEHDRENDWSYGVNVTVPIYQGGNNYALIREAKQTVAQYKDELRSTRLSVDSGVAEQWQLLESARQQLTNNAQQVDAATEAYEGYKRQFRAGTVTMQDVLDAHLSLIAARTAKEEAAYDVLVYSATLLAAMGVFDAARLGLPVQLYDPQAYISTSGRRWIGTSID